MKILRVDIDWNYKCSNSPDVQVMVDKIPTIDDMVFSVKDTLYWAQLDGYVMFFHDGSGRGYGGQIYHLNLDNGKQINLVGPWSSRTPVMNQYFEHSMEVRVTTDWETFHDGAMLISVLRPHLTDYDLISSKHRYTVVKRGVTDPCTRCKGSGRCDGAKHWNDPIELIRCPECGGRGQK